MSTQPPRIADKFLEWFCSEEIVGPIQGDIHELFAKRTQAKGRAYALLILGLDLLSVCRPFARKKKRYNSNNYAMFKNYYKVAIRNLMRHKMYSFIKIGGFAVGIAACLLISLFIYDEFQFDRHYEDQDRIYRVLNEWKETGEEGRWPAMQAPLVRVIREEIPELEKAGRMIPYNWYLAGNNLFRKLEASQNSYEDKFVYADQELLEILEFPFVYGDVATALTDPNTMVITRKKALKYFPNESPVGKTVILNDDTSNPLKITGVIEDLPSTTHLDFDFIITLAGEEFWPGEQTSWCCSNYDTYVKLNPDARQADVVSKLLTIQKNYIIPFFENRSKEEIAQMEEFQGFLLQPIGDVHLRSDRVYDNYTHGDIRVVYMFATIAFLILLLACINFINLSTAKSANRAKEVGLRKVVGSYKSNLIGQFITESVLFSLISSVLGIAIARLFLPVFNSMSNKELAFPFLEWWFLPGIFVGVVLVGLIAGLYPAFFLSKFRPVEVLKGKLSAGSKSSSLQVFMVVFQFAASVILIIGAVVVNRQMGYILNTNLGFDKDQVIMVRGTQNLNEQRTTFKNELKKLPEVQNITVSNYFPVDGTTRDQNEFWIDGRRNLDPAKGAQFWNVDENYLETLGMRLIEGRNFSQGLVSDSASMIVNQSFVKELGLENPIGKRVTNGRTWNIIGVVEDFHFGTVEERIRPLTMVYRTDASITAVKVSSDNMIGTVNAIASIWERLVPNQGFRYEFMDETYARMYDNVKRTGQIFTTFATLAILIACLGLFALTAFMVEQRRKEIGIRKVLGASLSNLVQTLTSSYLKLILISLIVAFPVGWYAMNNWLKNYEYRIDLSWDLLVISGGIIILISLVTISSEIIRAIKMNPADTLHSE